MLSNHNKEKEKIQKLHQQLSSGFTLAVGNLNLHEFEIQEPLEG